MPGSDFRIEEHLRIPMDDGVELAARVWIPEGADEAPVPAILEAIPYRRRDVMRARDSALHGYFAGRGYAALRVDMRGSGDSDGLLEDEYLARELEDGLETLRWIAAQPWCDGRVGIIGKSWGGFHALQMAALCPPELGAIVTVDSTDDRYATDVHEMGGCLLVENFSWASVMLALTGLPPDPDMVGDGWREMWQARLDAVRPWITTWLSHPDPDEYWQHGSVCQHLSRIEVPVLAVGGWADGYPDAVLRLLAGLESPAHGLLGPWAHQYPHQGRPGPAIDFLERCTRWWDRWLKGIENGVEAEPRLLAHVQDPVEPRTHYAERPGRWVALEGWPSPEVHEEMHPLGGEGVVRVPRDLAVGLHSGKWLSFGLGPDVPGDQAPCDAGSRVFDLGPFPEDVDILGNPRVELTLEERELPGQLAARLSDVGPEGASTRISFGVRRVEPFSPHATVELRAVGYRLPAGHRLRVALSASLWPMIWPTPDGEALRLDARGGALVLPVLRGGELAELGPADSGPVEPVRELEPGRQELRVGRQGGRLVQEVVQDGGRVLLEGPDLVLREVHRERHELTEDDPLSARSETRGEVLLERGDWRVEVATTSVLTGDGTHFHITWKLEAKLGGVVVASRGGSETVPRGPW